MNERTGQFLRFLASFLYKTDGTIKWISILIIIGIFIVGFYFLRVKPYLGDGVSRVQDLEKEYLYSMKDYFSYRSFQFLSLFLYKKTSDIFNYYGIKRFQVFYLFNCLSGIVFLYFLFRLQGELFETSIKRIVAFFFVVFQAYLILFMGYIEYYAIPLSLSVMYVYYAIRSIKGKTSVWYPALILFILILFHLLGVILLPSLVYLIFLKRKQESVLAGYFSYQHPKTLVLFLLMGTLVTLLLRPGPLDKLLIVPTQLFTFYNYAPYFIFHSSEILNLLIPGAGFSFFLIIWFRKILFTQIKNDPLLNFLVINVFFGLLLILFFNPSGNLATDWDIMTIPLLMLNILGIVILLRYSMIKINLPIYGICISQGLIFFVVWFLVNTMDDAAAERIITIRNHSEPSGNPHKPKYTDGLSFKYYYYIKQDRQKCREIAEICLKSVNDESLREYQTFYRRWGDEEMWHQFAKKYILYLENKIKEDSPSWSDYYNIATFGYWATHQYDKAVINLNKALELNPTNYGLHFWLGQVYEDYKKSNEALREYSIYESSLNKIIGFKVASKEMVVSNIFEMIMKTKRFDEGLEFFKARSQEGYPYLYYLGLLYWLMGDLTGAASCFDTVLSKNSITDKEAIFNMVKLYYKDKQYAKSWDLAHRAPFPSDTVWIALVDSLKYTQ